MKRIHTTFQQILKFFVFIAIAYSVLPTAVANACGCHGCCTPPPWPPSYPDASQGDFSDRIAINWLPPLGGGPVTTYNLFKTTNPNSPGCSAGTLFFSNINAGQYSFVDASGSLVPGVTYYYSLQSVGPGGTSFCSDIAQGFIGAVRPDAPLFVNASKGNPNDRIRVEWQVPFTGGPITGYRLYRSDSYTSCNDNYFLAALPATYTFHDDFNNIIPGRNYYYSMQSVGQGGLRSYCSNVDFGYIGGAPNVHISGLVYLNSPGNPYIPGVTISSGVSSTITDGLGRYVLGVPAGIYSLTASKIGYVIVPATFTNPVDATRDLQNKNFVAYCATGYVLQGNECVASTGLPGAPTNLQASDGTSTECVNVTWNGGERATSYILYRSQFPGSLGDTLVSGHTSTSFCDRSAVPGVTYYYTVRGVNSAGVGPLSNTDSGYRATQNPGDQDCDGDMVSDAQEVIDGTGVCDPGSFQLHLKSPAYTKYNTFLSQLNYLELMASGVVEMRPRITVYDINGNVIAQRTLRLLPGQQQDTDIRALVGRPNTYGVVRIDFDDQTPGSTLRGRMSNYRVNPDGVTFSFAFARELRNPTRGVTYATGNSIDPQGQSFLVPNWAEIVNLETSPQTFTVNLYAQSGQLLQLRRITVPALGSRDIQAGHELGQAVYLTEFRPDNGAARYLGGVARYSSNSFGGSEAQTYNFAFILEARAGNGDTQYAPTSNLTGQCWSQTNWLELVNTRERPVVASVNFRSPTGDVVGSSQISLPARSQFHFNADAFLEKGTNGSTAIASNEVSSLIAQSNVYYHDCQDNLLQTAYASQSRLPGRDKQGGSFNTFLGINNLLNVVSTSPFSTNYRLTLQSSSSVLYDQTISITPADAQQSSLSDFGTFGTQPEQYGSVSIRTPAAGQVIAESLRFREVNGKADFAMPTVVQ